MGKVSYALCNNVQYITYIPLVWKALLKCPKGESLFRITQNRQKLKKEMKEVMCEVILHEVIVTMKRNGFFLNFITGGKEILYLKPRQGESTSQW